MAIILYNPQLKIIKGGLTVTSNVSNNGIFITLPYRANTTGFVGMINGSNCYGRAISVKDSNSLVTQYRQDISQVFNVTFEVWVQ